MAVLQISRMFQVYSLQYVLLSADVADSIVRAFNRSCTGQVGRHNSPPNRSGLVEFFIGYLALFYHFLVIDSSEWFWSESLGTNVELMLVLPKALYIWSHSFSIVRWWSYFWYCYLCWQLYSLLRIWHSSQCRKWLVNFSAGKTYLVSSNCSINPGDINAKMNGMSLMTFKPWVCP